MIAISSDMLMKIRFLILDIDGVLTDGGLYYGDQGELMKKFNAKDGMGIKRLQNAGVEVALCSNGRTEQLVRIRADHMGVSEVYIGPLQKRGVVENWIQKRGLTKEECAYIGDDLNDLPAMDLCGLTACPSDAVVLVRESVDKVLTLPGGAGCVREFIDPILRERT